MAVSQYTIAQTGNVLSHPDEGSRKSPESVAQSDPLRHCRHGYPHAKRVSGRGSHRGSDTDPLVRDDSLFKEGRRNGNEHAERFPRKPGASMIARALRTEWST